MNQNNFLFAIIGIAIVGIVMTQPRMTRSSSQDITWDVSYKEDLRKNNIPTEYLKRNNMFDYDDPTIRRITKEINASSNNEYQAIRNTLNYVIRNIQYNGEETVASCVPEKASDVIKSGDGDCVSMAKLSVSILRGMGIASRTVGGCLSQTYTCTPLFAAAPTKKPVRPDMDYLDLKKRGGLHEWIEIWVPKNGWIMADPTSAEVFVQGCKDYLFYAYDYTPEEMCSISDLTFWNKCNLL